MNASAGPVRKLPCGVLASLIAGASAAGAAWLATALLPTLTRSYTRLDQLAALLLGALTGATVLAERAHRQRMAVAPEALAGGLAGGVAALAGVSLFAFGHAAVSPQRFLVDRLGAWGAAALLASILLGVCVGTRGRAHLLETGAIALLGGVLAGTVFTLPGASDAWQAIAFAVWGGAVGVAVGAPELWHAAAVVQALPPRGGHASLLSLREWPLDEGESLALAEARVAAVNGRVAFYPPAGGGTLDGRGVRRPRYLGGDGVVAIGRNRYRIRLLGARA